MLHKTSIFYYSKAYRGLQCSCGFVSSTGIKHKDRKVMAGHFYNVCAEQRRLFISQVLLSPDPVPIAKQYFWKFFGVYDDIHEEQVINDLKTRLDFDMTVENSSTVPFNGMDIPADVDQPQTFYHFSNNETDAGA